MTVSRHLQSEPFDIMRLLEETENDASGALVVFSGTVRNHHDGKEVVKLEYSAHRALVEKVLAELEQEVIEKFGVHRCRIVHREGTLNIGEDSVLIVVRAGHRPEAFEAARYAIDTLKKRAPIWKREHYADGSVVYQDGEQLVPEERSAD
ncbi:MAG: molybdenum cofactor biosynthesis protein MoaE [Xanthomonadaceae bacterium]|nr:molybdenum cofactor biosynthesis protein MoaE [Xanthomonadaceae bacterium]